MSANINNLTPAQQTVVNQIILTGKQLGVSDALIAVAVNIANAESTFNPNPPPHPPSEDSTASGLFQFTNTEWQPSWAKFVAANPQNPISTMSWMDAKNSTDAQIQVAFQNIKSFASGFDGNGGGVVSNYLPNGNFSSVTQALYAKGINIETDLLSYEYLRWSTVTKDIISRTNDTFTPGNLAAIQSLVSGTIVQNPAQFINTSAITSDGGTAGSTSAATQLVQSVFPIPSVLGAPGSQLITSLVKKIRDRPQFC